MIHHPAQFYPHACHYAVSSNNMYVLVQLQDESGEQARVPLTTDEAQHLVALLNLHINRIKNVDSANIKTDNV